MKNEVNRALVAKKKTYFQPQTQVTSIAIQSVILAGSAGDSFGIKDTESSDVW